VNPGRKKGEMRKKKKDGEIRKKGRKNRPP